MYGVKVWGVVYKKTPQNPSIKPPRPFGVARVILVGSRGFPGFL